MTISFVLHFQPPERERKRKATRENNKDIKCLGTSLEFDPKKYSCLLTGDSIFTSFIKARDLGEPFCIAKTNSKDFEFYEGSAAAVQLIKNPTEFNKTGIVFFKFCPRILIKSEVDSMAHFEILRVVPPGKGL